jgi:hypothetical protein
MGPVDISTDTWRPDFLARFANVPRNDLTPRPILGVHKLSRTHLEVVAAVQRTYLDLIFFFAF